MVRYTIASPTAGQTLFEALTVEGMGPGSELQFRIKLKEDIVVD